MVESSAGLKAANLVAHLVAMMAGQKVALWVKTRAGLKAD